MSNSCDPTDSLPGKDAGVVCHFLLQGTFPPQRLSLGLQHWRVSSLLLSHQGRPTKCSIFPISASNFHDFSLPQSQISAPPLGFHTSSCHSKPPVHPRLSIPMPGTLSSLSSTRAQPETMFTFTKPTHSIACPTLGPEGTREKKKGSSAIVKKYNITPQPSCNLYQDFPGGSGGKSLYLQCGRPGFDPWVGKIRWRRNL